MVFASLPKLKEIYGYVVADHEAVQNLGGATTVLIYVAPDCDSLCACRILTSILKIDFIAFTIKPVAGYEDLKASREIITDDIRSIFLLNCGASVDMLSFFQFDPLVTNKAIYIIDSHRPFHLKNISDQSGHLFVIGDEDSKEIEEFVEELLLELDQEGSQDDEDESVYDDFSTDGDGDDDLDDFVEDDLPQTHKRPRPVPRARKGKAAPTSRRRRAVTKAQEPPEQSSELVLLHSDSYYGTSSSQILFELAFQLKRDTKNFLWFAILGMTDQYVHGGIGEEGYQAQFQKLSSEAGRYDSFTEELSDAVTLSFSNRSDGEVTDGRIELVTELKFMLYRHWNLYDSMFHSRYVASRLGVWRRPGQDTLDVLMALMGLSIQECKQIFPLMSAESKQKLSERLSQFAHQFNLPDFEYRSFLRQINSKLRVSAADAVHAITSLLELGDFQVRHPTSRTSQAGSTFSSSEPHVFLSSVRSAAFDATTPEADLASAFREIWEDNFWTAYDALERPQDPEFASGIDLAVEMQKAIVRQGANLLEKRTIVSTSTFRYCFLTSHNALAHTDLEFFCHPRALVKLASFIIETLVENGKGPKPFLICALNPLRKTYLAAGFSSLDISPSVRNIFGRCFGEAARAANAPIKFHTFDTAIVEIAEEHIAHFIDSLFTLISEIP